MVHKCILRKVHATGNVSPFACDDHLKTEKLVTGLVEDC